MRKLVLALFFIGIFFSNAQSDNRFVQFAIVKPKDINLSDKIYKNIDSMTKSANSWMLRQTGKQIRMRRDKNKNIATDLITLNESSEDILNIGHKLPFHMYRLLKKKYKDNNDIVVFLFASDVKLKKESYCGLRTGRFAGLYIYNGRCGHKYDSKDYQGWDKIFIHEAIHALGGVEKCAKNSDGKYHVTDSRSDLMHKNGGGKKPLIDLNHDDYFGHNIDNCFDLNKSTLLYRP